MTRTTRREPARHSICTRSARLAPRICPWNPDPRELFGRSSLPDAFKAMGPHSASLMGPHHLFLRFCLAGALFARSVSSVDRHFAPNTRGKTPEDGNEVSGSRISGRFPGCKHFLKLLKQSSAHEQVTPRVGAVAWNELGVSRSAMLRHVHPHALSFLGEAQDPRKLEAVHQDEGCAERRQ